MTKMKIIHLSSMAPSCRSCRVVVHAAVVALFFLLMAGPAVSATTRPFRIGIVLPGDPWVSAVDGLKSGMKELGYSEGTDLRYSLENARGRTDVVADATRKFVADKVHVIFTITNTALKVVVTETKRSKIPVVFGSASGPVESGIISGYRDTDHVTGVTSGSIELVAKRLEILKEALPRVRRVAILGDLESESSKTAFQVARATAHKLGLTVLELKVRSREEAEETARKLTLKDTDALFLIPGLHSVGAVGAVAKHAKAARIPFAVYQVEHVIKDGALLSYGSSYFLQSRQAAALVDKILKGIRPSRLPIERPMAHELILNLATVKEIGVKFAPEIVNRADRLVPAEGSK